MEQRSEGVGSSGGASQLIHYPLLFGATPCWRPSLGGRAERGVFFGVVSRSATAMRLLLYDSPEAMEPCRVIPFPDDTGHWGDCRGLFVPGLTEGTLYHFQADGPWDPEAGHRFDGRARPLAGIGLGVFPLRTKRIW